MQRFTAHYVGMLKVAIVVLLGYSTFGRAQVGKDYYEDSGEEEPIIKLATLPPSQSGSGFGYLLPGNIGGSGADCFQDFPHLKKRFSWEQLEFFCQQKRIYDSIIFNSTVEPFSPAQQQWLDKLKFDPENIGEVMKVRRKEIRQATRREWRRFANAIRYMKYIKIDGLSHYDLIVMLSHPGLAPGARVGAAFLPWHREYLRRLEAAVHLYNPEAFVPYWDSTLDEGLPDPTQSVIWSSLFFGNSDDVVNRGMFRMFQFRADNESGAISLSRDAGQNGSLISPSLEQFFLTRQKYKDLTACVDLTVEQASRKLQEWVGGSMASVYYAAQDPVAFTAYAFMDYLWEQFRSNQTEEQRQYDYPPNYEACTQFHYGRSEMKPFEPLTNLDGLRDVYTDLFYDYEPRPTCSKVDPSCKSRFLFCDVDKERCLSKLKHFADCSSFPPHINPCYHASCIDGRCQRSNGAKVQPTASQHATKRSVERDIESNRGSKTVVTHGRDTSTQRQTSTTSHKSHPAASKATTLGGIKPTVPGHPTIVQLTTRKAPQASLPTAGTTVVRPSSTPRETASRSMETSSLGVLIGTSSSPHAPTAVVNDGTTSGKTPPTSTVVTATIARTNPAITMGHTASTLKLASLKTSALMTSTTAKRKPVNTSHTTGTAGSTLQDPPVWSTGSTSQGWTKKLRKESDEHLPDGRIKQTKEEDAHIEEGRAPVVQGTTSSTSASHKTTQMLSSKAKPKPGYKEEEKSHSKSITNEQSGSSEESIINRKADKGTDKETHVKEVRKLAKSEDSERGRDTKVESYL